MKKLKLLSMIAVAGGLFFMTSCAKDGADGLAGANGADGPTGPAGANGSIVTSADQAAYDAANGITGGKYYDNFASSSLGLPASSDPNITGNLDFFRCKQCHGWDLIGNKGAYVNRAPSATRPSVAPNNVRSFALNHNIREIFDAIKNTGGRNKMSNGNNKSLNDDHPDFGLILTDANIWDIVKFLKVEAYNTYNLYDIIVTGTYPTGSRVFTNVGKDGVAATGNAYFASNCAGCHGATGTAIQLDGGGNYIGDFLRDKPFETQHKIKFGQLGAAMGGFPTATEMDAKNLFKAGQDTLAFPG
ncbi:MAG: hypothetical protein COX70_01270, partial [Flavobacteriales bacterium CG_4_10_14_0_2_um_filter_32_8]